MLTGAAPQVGDRFLARLSHRRAGLAALAVMGLAAGGALTSCRPSRPAAPAAADATAAAPEAPPPAPPRGKQIAIGYSSNLLGEYEPCG
jgi:hypothetical protein